MYVISHWIKQTVSKIESSMLCLLCRSERQFHHVIWTPSWWTEWAYSASWHWPIIQGLYLSVWSDLMNTVESLKWSQSTYWCFVNLFIIIILSCWKKLKLSYSSLWESTSKLGNVTSRMGSHNVSSYLTQVNLPCLKLSLSQAGQLFIYLSMRDRSWVDLMYWDGLRVHGQSPVQVVISWLQWELNYDCLFISQMPYCRSTKPLELCVDNCVWIAEPVVAMISIYLTVAYSCSIDAMFWWICR